MRQPANHPQGPLDGLPRDGDARTPEIRVELSPPQRARLLERLRHGDDPAPWLHADPGPEGRHRRDRRYAPAHALAAALIREATGHVCVTDYLDAADGPRRALVGRHVPAPVLALLSDAPDTAPPVFSFHPDGTHWMFWAIAQDGPARRAVEERDTRDREARWCDVLGPRLLRLRLASPTSDAIHE